MPGKRPDRRDTDGFKREAIRLVEQEGMPGPQVAGDLGVNANLRHGW
ncbi:hypothetical protein [Lujinxingia sediminis]|nr:hypothetical protein [Lujinxingia sediminis]